MLQQIKGWGSHFEFHQEKKSKMSLPIKG